MTRLERVVATADEVAGSSGRTAKRDLLAALLRELDPGEVGVAAGWLIGEPRQGRVGVGWSTIASVVPGTRADDRDPLTVADLDHALDRLQAASGIGSNATRLAVLGDLLSRAAEAEASFIRRLLIGELRHGALDGVMVDAVARAAGVPVATTRRAAMLSGDLRRTAEIALRDGRAGLDAIGLTVGCAVLPMLASSSEDIAAAVTDGTGPVSVEWKLDGIRVQVHRDGDDVRVFTRNLNDATDRAPGVAAAALAMPARRFVLDGEVIGAGTGFFDVLHADGQDLFDAPLSERLAVLDSVAGQASGPRGPAAKAQGGGMCVPRLVTTDVAEAEQFLEGSLTSGHEGVMVKDLDSGYEAGRRGRSWRKVKPVRLFDLVVLAAEWGSGRRRGWLSNLHLGARDGSSFVMVGKTFKGMTDELLGWQTAALLERETGREGHIVHVRPELVVEIALDGAFPSTRYAGGVGLRFARLRRYRLDKPASEADTIDALRSFAGA